jgi:hypothetical protein
VEAPDGQIIGLAIAVAEWFRDQGDPAPDSVVPDPNGGIVFERRENGSSEVVQIWDDGHVEYMRFEGTRLVARETLLVGDLRQRGIQVVPRPLPDDAGHAELPDLNAGNRETDETLERERVLAQELCLQVEGPFGIS